MKVSALSKETFYIFGAISTSSGLWALSRSPFPPLPQTSKICPAPEVGGAAWGQLDLVPGISNYSPVTGDAGDRAGLLLRINFSESGFKLFFQELEGSATHASTLTLCLHRRGLITLVGSFLEVMF